MGPSSHFRHRVVALCCRVAALCSCALQQRPSTDVKQREVQYVMGTLLDVTVYSQSEGAARAAIATAFDTAVELDRLLSNYKPDSEISRLNAAPVNTDVQLSPPVYELLKASQELNRSTDGFFEPGVGGLLAVWAVAKTRQQVPPERELLAALAHAKISGIELLPGFKVRKTMPVAIDTGGIGKGFAVDAIVAALRRSGVLTAIVNFGDSSVAAIGSPPGEPAWLLPMTFPGGSPPCVIAMKDTAFSASHTMGKRMEIGGQQFGHVIDPRTGWPIRDEMGVVVLHDSATAAEALSKFLLLSKNAGFETITSPFLLANRTSILHRSEGFPSAGATCRSAP